MMRSLIRAGVVLVVTAACAVQQTPRESAAKFSSRVLVVGTVTHIFPAATRPPSTLNWGVTVRVEKVLVGNYAEPFLTFRVHSPTNAGLEIGGRYKIDATWTSQGYAMDDPRFAERLDEKS